MITVFFATFGIYAHGERHRQFLLSCIRFLYDLTFSSFVVLIILKVVLHFVREKSDEQFLLPQNFLLFDQIDFDFNKTFILPINGFH